MLANLKRLLISRTVTLHENTLEIDNFKTFSGISVKRPDDHIRPQYVLCNTLSLRLMTLGRKASRLFFHTSNLPPSALQNRKGKGRLRICTCPPNSSGEAIAFKLFLLRLLKSEEGNRGRCASRRRRTSDKRQRKCGWSRTKGKRGRRRQKWGRGEGGRGEKASKMRERKTGRKGGRANDHRGEREKEEKREGLRTEAGRVRTRRRLSPGDKRVSPERREIKGCPLKGFAPAGWGTPGRPRPRLREEG